MIYHLPGERLFPFQIMLLGVIFVFIGLITIIFQPFLAPLFLSLGLVILTGKRGLEFDLENQKYRDYKSFLFLKTGKWVEYNETDYIYINPSRTSQKVYTRVTEGSTMVYDEYNAYLLFQEGHNIYLISHKNKDILIEKLKELASKLRVEIVDNTSGD